MRKQFTIFLFCMLLTLCFSGMASAQNLVKGRVIASDTNEPVIGAAVLVDGTTQGVIVDMEGYFEIEASSNSTLLFRALGYKEKAQKVSSSVNNDLGSIVLETDIVVLSDITITSSIAISRKTPVAVSTVDPLYITERLGTQEFPEILKSTPGVYATKEGGGYGDSRINLRGFESANIAVMVNGVPMNDMEWGGVYWSNWAGLSDVTRSLQVQRGLGASKISAPSVGGSINIVTKTIDAEEGGSVYYGIGNDGYNKLAFNVSTGLNEKGWAFSVLGSKTWGDGYIDGTAFSAYTWFANISKKLGNRHSLSLTAFGSPQKHNKRYDKLTIEEWEKQPRGTRYNATYGFDINGQERVGGNYNYYHKPQISLNHNWEIDHQSSLSTSFYVSIGRGGGYSGQGNSRSTFYGASNGIPNTTYRKIDGTFDYGALMQANADSDNGSVAAMAASINEHMWYGLLSTYNRRLTDRLTLQAGIDLRYYKGIHKTELVDLYGGDYFIDPSRTSSSHYLNNNPDYYNEKLMVGDIVYRNFDGYVTQYGAFGQLEYSYEKLSVFVSGNINNNSFWRKEKFYEDNAKSKTVNKLGGGGKGGANYNIDEYNNVFVNIGYYSRTPFYSGGVFLSNQLSNETNPNSINEKVFSFEVGYGFATNNFRANLNLYRTEWIDKTMVKSISADAESHIINMNGVNALHQGIELDFKYTPIRQIEITGMFSIGDWRWNSNASGYWYNRNGEALNKYGNVVPVGSPDHAQSILNLKDLKVGNSAQTTAALGVTYEFMKKLRFGLDGNFFGRNYANYDISVADIGNSDTPQVFAKPWRIPSAFVFDARMSYGFKIDKLNANLYVNVNNVFNEKYITDAQDNGARTGGHGWRDATVFYGFGRTWSMGLKVRF